MGIEEILSAPRSPWQNPFVKRIIGSLPRECLDHMIIWNERVSMLPARGTHVSRARAVKTMP